MAEEVIRIPVTNGSTFQIETESSGDEVLVRLAGEFDLASEERWEKTARELRASDVTRLVLDLSALEFIDSTGVRLLLVEHRLWTAAGKELEVVLGEGEPRRILRLTGLDGQLRIRDAPPSE